MAHNESNARDINEATSEEAGEGTGKVAFICECGYKECDAPLPMTRDEYEYVRASGSRFAVLDKDHVIDEVEDVIEDFGRYVVLEKHSDGKKVADLRDPRSEAKSRRVLLVDDSLEVRSLLKILLSVDNACTVVGEAEDGSRGIEAAIDTRPDVVVLDLEMPVMDGWEALPKIVEAVPTANVVVFSSYARASQRKLAELGAFNFVEKGSDLTVIVSAVKDAALSGAKDARTLSMADGKAGRDTLT